MVGVPGGQLLVCVSAATAGRLTYICKYPYVIYISPI